MSTIEELEKRCEALAARYEQWREWANMDLEAGAFSFTLFRQSMQGYRESRRDLLNAQAELRAAREAEKVTA